MLRQHAVYAVRGLLKRPGFAAVAVATLALGIGANTAIFSIVNAVLLRPLPYPDAGRLVRVRGRDVGTHQFGNISPMDFLDLRARTRRLARLAAFNNYADATLTGSGQPERIVGTRVTADFFSVLETPPRIGRDFRSDDDVPGATPVAILSYGFWQRRFAGDPGVVGRVIHLNSVSTEVIGVLAPDFRHPLPTDMREPDVFVPLKIDTKENVRSGHFLQAIGRLRPDATLADAGADLDSIAADLAREYPKSNTGRGAAVLPLLESMVGSARTPLLVLLGAVVFVLLIACANLANLLLARSTSRQREIAVRRALGASTAQIVGQLLAESIILALAGGAAALTVAAAAMRGLAVLGADRLPRADAVSLDRPVLLFTVVLSVVTGVVFGVAPAWAAARTGAPDALREGGRSGQAILHRRPQQLLIVCEVAIALVLLVSAGLLVKSFWRLGQVDPGFHAEHVLTLQTSLPLARYAEGDEIPFYQRLEARLGAVPGVSRVGAINILPLSANYSCDSFAIAGRPPARPGQEPCAESRSVTPGYFETMGVPVQRGRAFTAADTEQSPGVLIVSDNMAQRFWPGQDPVGARLVYQGRPREIVGVVGGVKHFGLDRDVPFEMYTPHAQQPSYHTMTLVVRTPVDPRSLMPTIRRELAALDRDVPISNVKTMDRVVVDSTAEPRFRTLLVGVFAALAMLLSVVGVGGVIAYTVSRRTHEIGVRVALGATGGTVVRLVMGQGLRPAALGLAIGLAAAFALTRVLAGLLFGVSAIDAGVYAGAAGLLWLAAVAATYLPARRATSVDPMTALRAD